MNFRQDTSTSNIRDALPNTGVKPTLVEDTFPANAASNSAFASEPIISIYLTYGYNDAPVRVHHKDLNYQPIHDVKEPNGKTRNARRQDAFATYSHVVMDEEVGGASRDRTDDL